MHPDRLARDAGEVARFSHSRAYEGFYFEVGDGHNAREFAFASALRGTNQESEWARSEPLFPFPHG